MNNKVLLIPIFILLIVGTVILQKNDSSLPDIAFPSEYDDYNLVWNDEFNVEGAPDPSKWSFEHGFVRNNELQWYQQQNATCKGGILIIEGKRETVLNPNYDSLSPNWKKSRKYARYTSSCLKTKGKYSWKYGRFEIRARIDSTSGSWPAIWTLGEKNGWPSNGEIDIMEFYLKDNRQSILANAAWKGNKKGVSWDTEIISFDNFLEKSSKWLNKFHVWRMDWDDKFIRIYLDDELLNEISVTESVNYNGFLPFTQNHYLLLNLAIGSNGGIPDDDNFPITYEVDYVRVYQKIGLE